MFGVYVNHVIKGQFYKEIIGYFPFDGHFPIVTFHGKKNGSHNMTLLYPHLCYKKVCRDCTIVQNVDSKDSVIRLWVVKWCALCCSFQRNGPIMLACLQDKICFIRCNFGCQLEPFSPSHGEHSCSVYRALDWESKGC